MMQFLLTYDLAQLLRQSPLNVSNKSLYEVIRVVDVRRRPTSWTRHRLVRQTDSQLQLGDVADGGHDIAQLLRPVFS